MLDPVMQAAVMLYIALSARESSWGGRSKIARLRLRVDHDYAAGGERPEGGNLRDHAFTVSCPSKF